MGKILCLQSSKLDICQVNDEYFTVSCYPRPSVFLIFGHDIELLNDSISVCWI